MALLGALHVTHVFIYFSLVIWSTAEARNCYLPNGDLAPNDQPCFPENPESSCCGGSTYVCATNNMCAYYDGSYYVIGSCTDKSWNSPACPGYCFFRNHIHNTVFRCSANTYCCADGPSCNCMTGVNTHEIADFLPDYSDLVGSSVSLNTMVVTSSLMTPPGAIRTVGTSQGTSSFINPTTATGVMAITSQTATSSLSLTTSAVPEPSETGKSLKVGLGVGISLGAITIALAFLLWLVWRRWKAKREFTTIPPGFQLQHAATPKPVCEQGTNLYYLPQSPRARVYEAPGHEAMSYHYRDSPHER